MPLIPALIGRQKQEDFCECKATLVYRLSSRRARAVTHTHTKSGLVKCAVNSQGTQELRSFRLPDKGSFVSHY